MYSRIIHLRDRDHSWWWCKQERSEKTTDIWQATGGHSQTSHWWRTHGLLRKSHCADAQFWWLNQSYQGATSRERNIQISWPRTVESATCASLKAIAWQDPLSPRY